MNCSLSYGIYGLSGKERQKKDSVYGCYELHAVVLEIHGQCATRG